MNLHAIVSPIIGEINPQAQGTIYYSTGYTTTADGSRAPSYSAPCVIQVQDQALTASDIEHLDWQSVTTVKRGFYLYGDVQSIRRVQSKGGDLISFGGTWWLVNQVLETWDQDGWCKVAVIEQETGV